LNKYSSKEKEQFLSKALQYPSDKISTSGSVLPSKRFIDDYLLHPTHKFAGSLRTVGFTVNPEHSQGTSRLQGHCLCILKSIKYSQIGLNWTKVFSASPNMRVISLVRTNIMKMAISCKSMSLIALNRTNKITFDLSYSRRRFTRKMWCIKFKKGLRM
jgi:hypothetical protein